jgi:hypothetical protein
MMKNWKARIFVYLLFGIVAGGLLVLASGETLLPSLVLEIRDTETGQLLLSFPVKKGAPFFFQYTHSTAKTLVEEHFQVAGPNDIILTRMVYSSGGAGIPDGPPSGAIFRIGSDGRFVLEDLNQRFLSLNRIRIAYFYPFLLGLGGRSYSLSEVARGKLVDIRACRWDLSIRNKLLGEKG